MRLTGYLCAIALMRSTVAVCVLALAALTATARAQEDTTPPVLLELTIDTPTVDTTAGDATFRARARVADSLAGVQTVRLFIDPPAGSPLNQGSCVRVSGDSSDGLYDCMEVLPQFSPLGTWTIVDAFLQDAVGNRVELDPDDLMGLGLPTTFNNVDLSGSPDVDGDGVADLSDNCPTNANPNQEDADLDLIGDVCDPFPDDRDNEQAQCEADLGQCQAAAGTCPADLAAAQVALAAATADADQDGKRDLDDFCPGTSLGAAVDTAGCSQLQFCAGFDPTTHNGRPACRRADWMNDETVMRGIDRDCAIDKRGPGKLDDSCVPTN